MRYLTLYTLFTSEATPAEIQYIFNEKWACSAGFAGGLGGDTAGGRSPETIAAWLHTSGTRPPASKIKQIFNFLGRGERIL